MPNFAVLRVAKITSLKGLAGVSAHNTRTAADGLDHAEDLAPQMGGGIQLLAGQANAVEAWRERIEAVGLAKPRKDAVRAVEVVMSASPEWFAQTSAEGRAVWRDRSMVWAAETFGAENILSAHLHDDETTPHIHVLAVPLVQKERKKAGRPRKGRKGAPRTAVVSWGLVAADLIGSPERLTALQTAYASEVSDLGVRRGRPRRATGARHRSAAAYRAEAAEYLDTAQEAHFEALDELSSAKGVRMFADIDATQTITAAKQSAANAAVAFTVGLDAIDAGELVYCPGDGRRSASLKRRSVKTPHLPPDRLGFQKWREAVWPLISRLVGYARRLSHISTREQEVAHRSVDLAVEAAAIRRVADRQATAERAVEVQGGPADHDAKILAKKGFTRTARETAR